MIERDRLSDAELAGLGEADLETLRRSLLAAGDERFELVLRRLVVHAVPAVELVCRQRGSQRGLSAAQVGLAIEDACARLLLRLHRPDKLAPVSAIAAELAADCVDAQQPQRAEPSRLAPKSPQLRLIRHDGRPFERNNWRTS
jgi:hypothetical protein